MVKCTLKMGQNMWEISYLGFQMDLENRLKIVMNFMEPFKMVLKSMGL